MATDTANVPILSGPGSYFSKSAVTQIVGVLAALITAFTGGKFGLTANEQASIVTTILVAQSVIVYVMHQWFTNHVHASSLPPN